MLSSSCICVTEILRSRRLQYLHSITGQFADKPVCSQPSRRLVNLQIRKLVDRTIHGLVNSLKCLMEKLEKIVALNASFNNLLPAS